MSQLKVINGYIHLFEFRQLSKHITQLSIELIITKIPDILTKVLINL